MHTLQVLFSAFYRQLFFLPLSEKQFAETVWALQIPRSRTAVPLLPAACDPGIGKSLEWCRSQLFAGGSSLPHRVHALRRFLGRSDIQGTPVCCHRKNNIRSAVIISSVTFGIGHIINLFNGSGMNLVNNLCQIVFAIAVGFLLVTIFIAAKACCPASSCIPPSIYSARLQMTRSLPWKCTCFIS